jgi:hypothetical protein
MDGFEDRRAAARVAIEHAGAQPIMAEDFPAISASPRNACLDGVASSDACAIIVGSRSGWTAPSGKLVVEEEYEEALRRSLLILAYIENTPREGAATAFVARLTDYVSGHYRATYNTPDELEMVMTRHLHTVLATIELPMADVNDVTARMSQPYEVQHETTMRVVVAPERHEEVIDRVAIGTQDFVEQVFATGHGTRVKLFDYHASKEHRLVGDSLVVDERAPGRHEGFLRTHVEVAPEGIVTIDKVVSPTDGDDLLDASSMFFLLRGDVERALTSSLTFVSHLFDAIDQFQRHQRFLYGVAFANIGMRSLVDRIQKRSSYSMASDLEGVVKLEEPRILARSVLMAPAVEITRVIALLDRRIRNSS